MDAHFAKLARPAWLTMLAKYSDGTFAEERRLPCDDGESLKFGTLPSFVAVPLHDWAIEDHPVQRLWRMVDTAEAVLRYTFALCVGAVAHANGGTLPEDLSRDLRRPVRAPSFGAWRVMTERVLASLERCQPGASIVELQPLGTALKALWTTIGSQSSRPEDGLLELRNRLAHGGAWSARDALRFLDDSHAASPEQGGPPVLRPGHERRMLAAMTALAPALRPSVVAVEGSQALVALAGVKATADSRPEWIDPVHGVDPGVYYVCADGTWLPLSPLLEWGRATVLREDRPWVAEAPSPQVYLTLKHRYVLYSAILGDPPFGEAGDATLGRFRDLLRLDLRLPDAAADDGLQADADSRQGRQAELEEAVSRILSAGGELLWMSGPAGSGKSVLAAAIGTHKRLKSQMCVVVHRFTRGSERCSRTAFYRRAIETIEDSSQYKGFARDLCQFDDLLGAPKAKLERHFETLLQVIAKRHEAGGGPPPPRLLLLLDGLDEIATSDEEFPAAVLRWPRAGVVVAAVGRPELDGRFIGQPGVSPLLSDWHLPAMSRDDLRAMLLEESELLRYGILDKDTDDDHNPLLQAVTDRAAGLPLYVKLLLEDLRKGYKGLATLTGDLPDSLAAYYSELLRRYNATDPDSVRAPIIAMLALAREPLTSETLRRLLVIADRLTPDADIAIVESALSAMGALLVTESAPGRAAAYQLLHDSLRDHMDTAGSATSQVTRLARAHLARAAVATLAEADDDPASIYMAKYGVRHLIDEGLVEEACVLLDDPRFGRRHETVLRQPGWLAESAEALAESLLGREPVAGRTLDVDRLARWATSTSPGTTDGVLRALTGAQASHAGQVEAVVREAWARLPSRSPVHNLHPWATLAQLAADLALRDLIVEYAGHRDGVLREAIASGIHESLTASASPNAVNARADHRASGILPPQDATPLVSLLRAISLLHPLRSRRIADTAVRVSLAAMGSHVDDAEFLGRMANAWRDALRRTLRLGANAPRRRRPPSFGLRRVGVAAFTSVAATLLKAVPGYQPVGWVELEDAFGRPAEQRARSREAIVLLRDSEGSTGIDASLDLMLNDRSGHDVFHQTIVNWALIVRGRSAPSEVVPGVLALRNRVDAHLKPSLCYIAYHSMLGARVADRDWLGGLGDLTREMVADGKGYYETKNGRYSLSPFVAFAEALFDRFEGLASDLEVLPSLIERAVAAKDGSFIDVLIEGTKLLALVHGREKRALRGLDRLLSAATDDLRATIEADIAPVLARIRTRARAQVDEFLRPASRQPLRRLVLQNPSRPEPHDAWATMDTVFFSLIGRYPEVRALACDCFENGIAERSLQRWLRYTVNTLIDAVAAIPDPAESSR